MVLVEKHGYGEPSWFDLMTKDVEKSREFYGGLFGWTFDIGPEESGFYSMAMINNLPVAGMGQMQNDVDHPAAWTVYFNVESADQTCDKIKSQGGTITIGPMDVFSAGRMAVCEDSNGAVFGIWQAKDHAGSKMIGDPGTMCWCEVNTRDDQKAREFYSSVFGLTVNMMESGVGGTDYYTLHNATNPLCGILRMTEEWGDMPPHWMCYFAIKDAKLTAEKAKSLGGTVPYGPFDTPFGAMAVIVDPMGAAFSVIVPKS